MTDVAGYAAGIGTLQLVGVAGFLVYMGSFSLVQLGRLDGNGAAYSAANVLAASLVAMSLLAEFNLSSALIQASWIVMGLAGLALRLRARRHHLPRRGGLSRRSAASARTGVPTEQDRGTAVAGTPTHPARGRAGWAD